MNLGPALVALSGILLSMTLVTQTGALTAVSADRSIEVTVADDKDALLGIDVQSAEIERNATANVTLLTVENRFERAIDLDTAVTGDEDNQRLNVTAVDVPASLSSGQRGSVVATVECVNATTAEPLTIDLTATGDGISVALSRELDATCA